MARTPHARPARTRTLAALLIAGALLAACGSPDGDDTSSKSKRTTTEASTPSPEEVAADRVRGSTAVVSSAEFTTCITEAGFTSSPPQHGVAAEWTHPSGAVLAVTVGVDADQLPTIAAQFSGSGEPAEVVGGDTVIGGSGAPRTDAVACARLR